MRLTSNLIVLSAFLMGAILAFMAATFSAGLIERISVATIAEAFEDNGHGWAEVSADGLQIYVGGTAPTEAQRFRALTVAGEIVDAHRIIDQMDVEAGETIAAPHFSVEILRNDDNISLIGLIPARTDRDAVVQAISDLTGGADVTDMLESADHPVPAHWDVALAYGLSALTQLPQSQISIDADMIAITAISSSAQERAALEEQLLSDVPGGLELYLEISAPRPVITPFTLRFLIEDGIARFDACSAETEAARVQILAAGLSIGVPEGAVCTIGLGNPSPTWADAVETGLRALAEIGAGSITFSDADVTLIAAGTTPQALFDRIIGELEADLPPVFSLHSVLLEPESDDASGNDGPPEFFATLSPEGLVQLRGRLTTGRERDAVESYARSRFGVDSVYAATRLDGELPAGWPIRVLAALQALAELNNGSVVVQPDIVSIRGNSGNTGASAEITRILSEKLGDSENYEVSVAYHETLDPTSDLPTPQECVDLINAAITDDKIVFAPGSVTIDATAGPTLERIGNVMADCQNVEMEIGGHTDSQGREGMNQNLSQSRAQAVLNALLARRVLTSNLTARGYGETNPIADNETEEGREANRRIEFTLVATEVDTEAEPDLDEDAQSEAQDEQN